MEAYVREALAEGLAGWQVTDCRVTMTDCGYASPVTSRGRLPAADPARAGDRAGAGRDMGLRAAGGSRARGADLDRAGRRWPRSGRLGGRVTRPVLGERPVARSGAVLPVARVRGLQHQLPGLSMGEGILETRLGGYQPIGSDPPRRPRSRPSPLDRDAWLASLAKRG